jgi:cysteine desulfurase family protein (TIGR01976 family)
MQTNNGFFDCRKDFPALERTYNGVPLAYLDGPAGTQVPKLVIDAISDYYRHCNANTHGTFVTSQESDRIIETGREKMAAFLGAESSDEISFGANMTSLTYALSKAIARKLRPGDEILITQLDHEANRGPWLALREHGVIVKEIALTAKGTLDPEDFEQKISERTRLVAMGYASNALGTVNDISFARRLTYRYGAWLFVDAVHYAPHFSIDVRKQGMDFLVCSAYKFYGPHVGILYSRGDILERLDTDRLRTQDQRSPLRIETGTLNHAAIAGVSAAVDYITGFGEGNDLRTRIVSAMEKISRYEHELAKYLYQKLPALKPVTIWGPSFENALRAPTISFTYDGLTALAVCKKLADSAVCAWDGHFYAIRPIEILGLLERGGVTRIGISMYNTQAEIDRLLKSLESLA